MSLVCELFDRLATSASMANRYPVQMILGGIFPALVSEIVLLYGTMVQMSSGNGSDLLLCQRCDKKILENQPLEVMRKIPLTWLSSQFCPGITFRSTVGSVLLEGNRIVLITNGRRVLLCALPVELLRKRNHRTFTTLV